MSASGPSGPLVYIFYNQTFGKLLKMIKSWRLKARRSSHLKQYGGCDVSPTLSISQSVDHIGFKHGFRALSFAKSRERTET